jgi:hypothetical protein
MTIPSLRGPWRVSGLSGLLFVGLSCVAAGMNVESPPYHGDRATLALWLGENGESFRRGHFVAALAFLLFYFPFFAGLCECLRQAEGTPAIWSRVAWAGAIMSPAAGTTSGAFIVALALVGGRASPDVAALAAAAGYYAFVVSGAVSGVVTGGAAIVILRTGVFPGWLGWSAATASAIAVAGCAAVVERDPGGVAALLGELGWLLYFLWIALASVALIRTDEQTKIGNSAIVHR